MWTIILVCFYIIPQLVTYDCLRVYLWLGAVVSASRCGREQLLLARPADTKHGSD